VAMEFAVSRKPLMYSNTNATSNRARTNNMEVSVRLA
jgi:hypothetical protein